MPGVKKKDIHVAIDGNLVSISAEVKQDKEQTNGGNLVWSKRYYGRQSRSFTLPHKVDQAKAEAKCENGVLELTLPKKEASSVREVPVQ